MDVDAKVNDLLTNIIEHGTEKQSNGASLVIDFFFQKLLKSEETGPPIHEERTRIVSRLGREGMLEDKLQLIWDNVSPSVRPQDIPFQKVHANIHCEGHDSGRSSRGRHFKKRQRDKWRESAHPRGHR